MKTTIEQFTSLLGHVCDGCEIVVPSGRVFTIKNTLRGWVIIGPDGVECSGYLPSYYDVEYFVINGLQSA